MFFCEFSKQRMLWVTAGPASYRFQQDLFTMDKEASNDLEPKSYELHPAGNILFKVSNSKSYSYLVIYYYLVHLVAGCLFLLQATEAT